MTSFNTMTKQSCSNCKHAVNVNDEWCCGIAPCTMWEKKGELNLLELVRSRQMEGINVRIVLSGNMPIDTIEIISQGERRTIVNVDERPPSPRTIQYRK